jgi:assimilatory nitrate reductase catalytic subunit
MIDSIGEPGGIRALFVMGSNPVVSAPNALHVEQSLRKLDFLAVADFFLSETAQIADVVLPSAQWAEESGTTTNLEGRVILRQQQMQPPDGVRSDLEILGGLAAAMGKAQSFPISAPEEVFGELRRATAGGVADYSGITYEKIRANQGVFWPCPTEDHPGTPRLFAGTFPTPNGRAQFHVIRHQSPAETVDDAFPLYLTTGRISAQYQSGTQTRRVASLQDLAPEPLAELHPSVAKRHGLTDGDVVRLASRRGQATFKARITKGIRPDTVFVPFHWSGVQSVNRLTNPVLDPISRMPEFKVCAVRIESPGAAT